MLRSFTPLVPSAAAFLPTSISGLQVWLDPNDNATITQSGGTCSAITDKSGNGNTFSQGTSGQRPSVTAAAINGLQAFTFTSAATKYMTATLSANLSTCSIFALVKASSNTADTDGYVTSYVTGSDLSLCAGAINSIEVYLASVGHTAVSPNNTFNTGTVYLIGFTYAPAGTGHVITYINNVQQTDSTQGFTPRQLNKSLGWGGSAGWGTGCNAIMGDMVIYNSALSSTDRDALYNNFFKPKWGLP